MQSKNESSKFSRAQIEEVSSSVPTVTHEDMSPPKSLDRHGGPETLVESTPNSTLQSRPVGQLNSYLKKVDELGNSTLKEIAHVTFQLGTQSYSGDYYG